jgi:hypothetical protein
MTENSTQPEPPARHHPPTTHYPYPEYNAQQWPPTAGGPGIPPAEKRRGFIKQHGKLLALLAVAVVVAGSLGVGIGQATFDPQVITKTETKTVTKEVEVTPTICVTALARAAEVNDLSSRFAGAMSEIIDGVRQTNVSKITGANSKIDDINAELKTAGPKFVSARDSCLASAK